MRLSCLTISVLIFWIFVLAPAAGADVIYVDNGVLDTSGEGDTWTTAYKYLQDALDTANYGDVIRVAEGHLPNR